MLKSKSLFYLSFLHHSNHLFRHLQFQVLSDGNTLRKVLQLPGSERRACYADETWKRMGEWLHLNVTEGNEPLPPGAQDDLDAEFYDSENAKDATSGIAGRLFSDMYDKDYYFDVVMNVESMGCAMLEH